MTRVKYPTKKEIHAQVREIIERSEMFDEITGEEYTECQRVNNKNTVWKSTVYGAAGIAAVVVLMITVETMTGSSTQNSHAYGPSLGEIGEIYSNESISAQKIASEDFNNENIYDDNHKSANSGSTKIDSVSIYTNVRGTYKNDKISIARTYQTPNVSKQGNTFTEISSTYAEYFQRIDNYLQNKYYASSSAYDGYKEVSVKADFTVSHNSSYYSGVQNVISFTNKYEEVADSSSAAIEKKIEVYYSNYDVDTGQRISLSDVYISEVLYSEIAGIINQEINELVREGVFTLQSISDKYLSKAEIAEVVKNDDNWYISPNGSLVIQCNNFRTATDLDRIEYSRPESFIIDKSVLEPLDKNSKYVTYQ